MKSKKLLISIICASLLFHGAALYYLGKLEFISGIISLEKFSLQPEDLSEEKWSAAAEEIATSKESNSLPSPIKEQDTTPTRKEALASSKSTIMPLESPSDLSASDLTESADLDEPLPSIAIDAPSPPPFAEISNQNKKGASFESDLFAVDVEYAKKKNSTETVFKITIKPSKTISFKPIRQNTFFLVDRSHSIPNGRYRENKKAIKEALAVLKKDDCFNILLFDDKIVHFSPNPVQLTDANIEKACAFLNKEGHGGIFTTTDLARSLENIIPENVKREEVNNAILLSDGDTYLSLEKQRLLIKNWSAKNKGKVSLFCVASGVGNNLDLLEMMSTFNKGVLTYALKDDWIEGRLKKLLTAISCPIGKEIVVTPLCNDPSNRITLFPKKGRLPDLYLNRPYVIYGTMSHPTNFTLFLQGRYYDRPFDIKKKIDFISAKPAVKGIEEEWVKLASHEHYEQFFQDGNPKHLDKVKALLAPLNLYAPFLR